MVSNCGVVKLTDFGLARAMDRSSITKPGFVKGKISYLAPELTYEAEPSAQTDVFSVGVVLWEVLAGEKALQGRRTHSRSWVRSARWKFPDLAEFRRRTSPTACATSSTKPSAAIPIERYRCPAERWHATSPPSCAPPKKSPTPM